MDSKEQAALSAGGTHPTATDPGLGGAGPMGGGVAVPPDAVLQNSGSLGDTDSLDDAGAPGIATQGNIGTNLDEETTALDQTPSAPGTAQPHSPASGGAGQNGDSPTGGLSSTGTIGGTPTGAAENGSGERGL